MPDEVMQNDERFASMMDSAKNVLLAIQLRKEEILLQGDNPLVKRSLYSLETTALKELFPRFESAVLPIPLFQQSATGMGVTTLEADLADGICRRVSLSYFLRDDFFPQLGVAAFLQGKNINRLGGSSENHIRLGNIDVPLDDEGKFLITWYGKGGPDATFQYYSFCDVIASSIKIQRNKPPLIVPSAFKDKYVFIGSNAAGLFDLKTTPMSSKGLYPGTEIHATILSNLLQKDFLIRVKGWIPVGVMFLFSFVICFMFQYVFSIRYHVIAALSLSILWSLLAIEMFIQFQLWLDVVMPLVAIIFSFTVAAVVSYQTEGKARRHLRTLFDRYLSPTVVAEILNQKETIELGGKEIVGTVLFSDIKDFTTLSEQLSPREVVELLNKYFSTVTDIIHQNEGMLDKYLGDAVMAMFGAPLSSTRHAELACSTALEIQKHLRQAWQTNNNRYPTIETRIGINSGTMIVGNIGSPQRLDYTSIGDTVNLASRLEGVNKIYGTSILIGESTRREIQDGFVVRELDIVKVKGKDQAVVVYELIGRQSDVRNEITRTISLFQDGLRWYRERDFEKALAVFRSILAEMPNDGPSREYVQRCEKYLMNPPLTNWDGIFKLDLK